MTTVPRKCASALEPTRWALACVLVSRVVRARKYAGRVPSWRLSPTRPRRADVVPGPGLPGPSAPTTRTGSRRGTGRYPHDSGRSPDLTHPVPGTAGRVTPVRQDVCAHHSRPARLPPLCPGASPLLPLQTRASSLGLPSGFPGTSLRLPSPSPRGCRAEFGTPATAPRAAGFEARAPAPPPPPRRAGCRRRGAAAPVPAGSAAPGWAPPRPAQGNPKPADLPYVPHAVRPARRGPGAEIRGLGGVVQPWVRAGSRHPGRGKWQV